MQKIAEPLTPKQLQEILLKAYEKGNGTKEVDAMDLVEEMSQQLLLTYTSKNPKLKG